MPKTNTLKTPTKSDESQQLITENTTLPLTIPWSSIQGPYEKALKHAAQHVKTDGFRIGKVPLHIVEKMVDQQRLFEEALQEVFPPVYRDALAATKKIPLSQPDIEPEQVEKNKDWKFIVHFAERPEVKLGDYKKVVKGTAADAEKEIAEHATKEAKEPLTDTQKEDIRVKHIFKALVQSVEPHIQELLIRAEVNRSLQQLSDQLQQLNLSGENYLKSRNITIDQLRQEYAAHALASLQIEFILAEIAKDQKMTVEDAEIDETIKKTTKAELTEDQKKNSEYRTYIFSALLKQKVLSFLLSIK